MYSISNDHGTPWIHGVDASRPIATYYVFGTRENILGCPSIYIFKIGSTFRCIRIT